MYNNVFNNLSQNKHVYALTANIKTGLPKNLRFDNLGKKKL